MTPEDALLYRVLRHGGLTKNVVEALMSRLSAGVPAGSLDLVLDLSVDLSDGGNVEFPSIYHQVDPTLLSWVIGAPDTVTVLKDCRLSVNAHFDWSGFDGQVETKIIVPHAISNATALNYEERVNTTGVPAQYSMHYTADFTAGDTIKVWARDGVLSNCALHIVRIG